MIIRVLLIAAFAGFAIAYLRGRGMKGRAWSLIFLCLLGAVTVGAVVFPDATTVIANAVGVGRGADLLIYLLIVLVGFIALALHKRSKVLQRQITELVRDLAIERSKGYREGEGA